MEYYKNYDLIWQNVDGLKIMNIEKLVTTLLKKIVYEVGVGFYGTHQTSWYFLIIYIYIYIYIYCWQLTMPLSGVEAQVLWTNIVIQ
jgi:hypothetical protein